MGKRYEKTDPWMRSQGYRLKAVGRDGTRYYESWHTSNWKLGKPYIKILKDGRMR